MARRQKEGATKRTLGLHDATYKRLEKFKIELMQKLSDPKVTYDDAINSLLNEHEKKEK